MRCTPLRRTCARLCATLARVQGYFVGRKELTAWIQANFQANFQKIEDLASGVVYCQIIDSIYPEVKVMGKVKRDAKVEVDFIHNFKVGCCMRRQRLAAACLLPECVGRAAPTQRGALNGPLRASHFR